MNYEKLYGEDDLRVLDFDVYIGDLTEPDTTVGELDTQVYLGTVISDKTEDLLDIIFANNGIALFKIGKLDRPVSYSTEVDEEILDNELIHNIIGKTSTISFEHIASNNEIKQMLRDIDGHDIVIMLRSRAGSERLCIMFPEARYYYEENSVSGNIARLPVSVTSDAKDVVRFKTTL